MTQTPSSSPSGSMPDPASGSGLSPRPVARALGGHDAFDVLGLAARFDLSPAEIQRAYLERVSAAATDEGAAARLNRARQTLADPEQRARELLARLERLGGAEPAPPGADRALPDGFLMEMMEAREQMEADVQARRGAGRGSGTNWDSWGEARRAAHIRAVAALFERMGARPGDQTDLPLLRKELNAWRYIERMLEQLGDHDA